MAVLYLQPEDLTPAQAARVLDFLNRAASAEEIAARVEFPGELDMVLRLAQQLLDARAALDGGFADLRQVAAVPLIGPERFTDLCASLLGLDPRRWLQEFSLFAQRQLHVADGVDHPQQQLAALQERVQLDLTAAPRPAWLGQALQVTVAARDLRGRPLPDRQLTVEASAGTLETAYGYAVQRARAVSVRTGADGTARLRLRFTTIEPLTADQQAALEEVLGQLDAGADSPNLLHDAFMGIAAAYQDERRHALRSALDIYARQWKAQFFDQVNPGSLGFDWPLETCVVRADCHPGDGGTAGIASAVVVAHWKNWVGAWFEFLGEYLTQQARLRAGFAAAKRRGASGYRLADDLLGEAYSFVADQKGLAAEWLSQRVVKYALNDFLGREADNVDDVTQRELFSNLEAAAGQLTRASRGAIAMVNQTRVDLDDKITKVGGINAGVLDEVRGLHADMLARATLVDNQLAGFTATKAQLDQRLAQFDSRFQTFTTQYTDFGERFATFNVDYGDFRNRHDDIGGRLTLFDQNLATFDTRYTQFNTDLTGFQTQRTQLAQDVTTMRAELNSVKADVSAVEVEVDTVTADLGAVKTDVATVQTGLGAVRSDITAVKADLGAVRTDVAGVKTDLGTLGTDFTGVKTDLGVLRTDITTVKTDLGRINTEVTAVKTDLGKMRTEVTAFETELGGVRTDMTAVKTDLSAVRTEVTTVKNDLGTVRTEVTAVKTELGTVRTEVIAVKTDLGTVRTDVTGLTTDLGTVRTDVAGLKTDVGRVKTDIATVNTGLATVRTDVAGLKTDLGTVRTDVTVLKTDVGRVKTDIATVNTDLGAVRTDVASVKTDLSKVRTDVTAVRTDLGAVRTDVTAVRTDLGTVKQNVNTLNVRLPPGTGRIG